MAMLALLGLLCGSACAPGGLGTYGETGVIPNEDFAQQLRSCGLLTEGEAPFLNDQMSWYDQCMLGCLMDGSCDDLTAVMCYTGEYSPQLESCFQSCEPEDFYCHDSGEQIPGDWVCDYYDDCEDGSDEVGCSGEGQFECENGSGYIPVGWICDGDNDCGDYSDEVNCPPDFQCHDGSGTVPPNWVCDMYDDCMDGSDEYGCAELICPDSPWN